MSTRNIRSNFLTDKATFGNSTMPIGSIVPVFKANDDKVTDNGVVLNLGQVATGAGGGTGYVTNLDPNGFPTLPIVYDIPATAFEVGTDNINLPNHPFIQGDKLSITTTTQAPNQCKLGASIQSFTIDNGGSGYTSAPLVQVTDNGSGPLSEGEFSAVIDSTTGEVTEITVNNGGSGYQFPQVTLTGGGGTSASATANLSPGGAGGVEMDKGFTFLVDYVNANNIRLSRSNGDIFAGKYYNITDVGSNGTVSVASSTGFGLRVGIVAYLNEPPFPDGSVKFVTIKNPGYGYKDGDVVYISQPGSSGTARVEIVTTDNRSASEPEMQYEGWLYCDGSEYDAQDYPLLYEVIENKYGGLAGTYNPEDFGQSSSIKFNVPDYKGRKIVGAGGGISGGGSPVSGNVISTVGATGGRWFFSKTQQEALFDIGNIVITGYPNISEFVGGTLKGEITLQIGPLQEKIISAVPEHDHAILTSQAIATTPYEGTGQAIDQYLASYKDDVGQVQFFIPNQGVPLFHTHGVVDYIVTDPSLSTFGNTSGIGEVAVSTITASNISADSTGAVFNIPSHKLTTGYKIRVRSNDQSTPCTFSIDGNLVPLAQNSEWYIIRIDDDNFYVAQTKYKSRLGQALEASTNGSGGQNIVLEMGYKIAGNLPSDTTTVIQQPADTVYDIDDSYSIGGKTIQLPGGESTSVETIIQQDVPGSYTVPAPTIEQDATGVFGRLTGAGGGGGTTTVAGQNGGDTYYEFNYNGTQIQIVADGGDGGATGNAGGAGGSGGQARIVSGGGGATNVTATGTYTVAGLPIEIKTYVDGNDGSNGGPVVGGSGGTSALIGGAGGDGARTLFEGSNTITTTYTSPSLSPTQYVLPSTWPLSSVKAILRGGGGGSGGTGDGGANWWAGSGGDGKTITVNLLGVQPGDPLNIYVGGGGSAGSGRNPGQKSNTGFSQGGNGGSGTGGGGGGAGGSSSAVGIPGQMVAGAGGGGGGGAAGDANQAASQNGQPNSSNDGAQNLNNLFSGSGNVGQNSVCSGGGGGGGGGGIGITNNAGGGSGAGNGSNAVRDGFGAGRGQSAYRGSGAGATASLISTGNAGNGGIAGLGQQVDGTAGSVEIEVEENTTFYGDGGGGGGSGNYIVFQFDADNINAGTLVVGDGGSQGGDAGNAYLGYQITETTDGGTTTSTTSGLFDSASPNVDYVQSGTGSGVNGGFLAPDGEQYLRFFGNEAVRYVRSISVDASSTNAKGAAMTAVRIRVIRGNGSNGGEQPNEPLELFASNDNATSFNKIGTISASTGPTTWTLVDIVIPTVYQVPNLVLEIRQTRFSAGNPNNDNYGIDYVAFSHEEIETTVTSFPSGRTDLGIEFVTERIEPQGDPINSSGLEVNEGTFTLSSAVKLNVDSTLQPNIDIPLLTRYHLVKYMIRAY